MMIFLEGKHCLLLLPLMSGLGLDLMLLFYLLYIYDIDKYDNFQNFVLCIYLLIFEAFSAGKMIDYFDGMLLSLNIHTLGKYITFTICQAIMHLWNNKL